MITVISLNLFSLAGIPPLSGFLSKLLVLTSLVEMNYLKLFLFLVLISLISTYYYIRVIKILVFSNKKTPKFVVEITDFSALILLFSFYFNIILLIAPETFLRVIYSILSTELMTYNVL